MIPFAAALLVAIVLCIALARAGVSKCSLERRMADLRQAAKEELMLCKIRRNMDLAQALQGSVTDLRRARIELAHELKVSRIFSGEKS